MKLPSRIIDLSSPLENETVYDPPFMRPKIEYHEQRRDRAAAAASCFRACARRTCRTAKAGRSRQVQLTTHNGTHMDAPIHFQSKTIDGKPMMTIDQVPLDWFFRPGVKLDFRKVPDGHVVTAAEVEAELKRIGHALKPFDIVLVNTRASECIGTDEYLTAGCGMGREATLYLTSRGVRVDRHRRLGLGRAVRAYAQALAGDARSVDHLGRPQGRPRDSLLPHGEAVQSRTAARRRFHGGLLPVEDEKRLGRLDARGGAVRLV